MKIEQANDRSMNNDGRNYTDASAMAEELHIDYA